MVSKNDKNYFINIWIILMFILNMCRVEVHFYV